MNYFTLALPIALAAALILLFIRYFRATSGKATVSAAAASGRSFFAYRCDRRDVLPLVILTAVTALVTFTFLGSAKAPESFMRFDGGEAAVVDMGEEHELSRMMYYTGIFTGDYTLQTSTDGQNWQEFCPMPQEYSKLLRWLYADPSDYVSDAQSVKARYIRVSAQSAPLLLGELAVYDADGWLLDSAGFTFSGGAEALFDEQNVIPAEPDWYNGSYFDEIYHVRTAYEHYLGESPYEISHPPLGKLIIMLGISVFGLNPFGWRFMGALFGVMLIPLLYIFIKNMFGKRRIAIFGALLFACDFMRYTQTRLATIDTYAVFFILLMYLFMLRWLAVPAGAPLKESLPPLMLSGLFFGLGACSKWTCLYAGAGLAVIYAIHMVRRCVFYKRNGQPLLRRLAATLGVSVLFFIVIPAALYCLCYIPYAVGGKSFSLGLVLENQKFMFTYHSGVTATHPYGSRWWQWILDLRPILYYYKKSPEGMLSSFAAFGNPVLYWGGLLALLTLTFKFIRQRDGRAGFILIGWTAQVLPWVFISRVTFAYHYFPAELFLVLALCWVANDWLERDSRGSRLMLIGLPTAAATLFVLFYPVLSGLAVLRKYAYNILKWFPSWPF